MMVRLSKGPVVTIMEPATIETESKREKIESKTVSESEIDRDR
jgi:hypothetical protein